MARPIQMDPNTGRIDDPIDPPRLYPTAPDNGRVRGGPAGVGGRVEDPAPGGPLPPTAPPTSPPTGAGQNEPSDIGADTLGSDQVGDIPPPPFPDMPQPLIQGPGVAGIAGTEAGTFARPGSAGAAAFRSPAFVPKRPPRFGPGVANAGGGQGPMDSLGLTPDEAAELLAGLAGNRGGF